MATRPTNPFGGADPLTDIPPTSEVMRGQKMTLAHLEKAIGATVVDVSRENQDGGEEGEGDKPSGSGGYGGGGNGGDEPPSSEDEGGDDGQEEEEEEEEQVVDEETSGDEAPVPVPVPVGTVQHLGGNRQHLIVLNFRMAIGDIYNVTCFHRVTFASARDAFFCQYPAKKSDRTGFRFFSGGVEIVGRMSSKTLPTLDILDGAIIEVLVAGAGGASKVIKTHLKTKTTETTTSNDKSVYEQGYLKALALHSAQSIDIPDRLKKIEIDKLKELQEYLKKDKSTSLKKAEKIHEYLEEFSVLQSLQHKLNAALHRLKDLTFEAIEDEEGKFDHKAFAEKVGNLIAVKEDNDMRL